MCQNMQVFHLEESRKESKHDFFMKKSPGVHQWSTHVGNL